eukprot:3149500-Rhodomonas_salina.2
MSGTEIPYDATRYSTGCSHIATGSGPIVLRACYAESGTEVACATRSPEIATVPRKDDSWYPPPYA